MCIRDRVIDIAERVDLVSETIVRWHLDDDGVSWLHWLDVTKWEVSMVSVQIVVLGHLVYANYIEYSSVGNQFFIEFNFITC